MTKTRYTAGFRTRPAAPRAAGLRDTSGTSTASGQSGAAAALPESHFDVVVENDRTMLKLKDRYAGLYTAGFISARGKDDSAGTGGGGGFSLEEVWNSMKTNTDAYKDTLIDVAHIPPLAISKVTGLQDLLDAKADLASTLSGYGITDAYTTDEVDALLSAKADTSHKHSAADITSGVLSIDRIPTIPYSKTSGVQAALVSGTSIKTINGVSILGSGNIVTPDTTYTSKAAASGGTDLSLVTTGEKYTWNAKQAAISDLSTIRSNAADGAAAYGWGDHSKAGYLRSIANLVINGTVYDGTSTVTITTPTYTLASFGITASAAELNYTKGVTSAIQTQLNAKANASALGNYLPLSGGTMSNTNVVTNLNADLLDGTHLKDILYTSLNKADVITSAYSLNDAVNSGINFTSWDFAHSSYVNDQPAGNGASSAGSTISFGTVYPFQLYTSYNGDSLYCRTLYKSKGWSDWRKFAFSDSNVASASKLLTARTIWGQSFDGTSNVTGHLLLGTTGNAIMGANEFAGGMLLFTDGRTVVGSLGTSTTNATLIRSKTGHVLCGDASKHYTMLDSGNYNTYSPSLTGTGASGTWGINITGKVNDFNSVTIPFDRKYQTSVGWYRLGIIKLAILKSGLYSYPNFLVRIAGFFNSVSNTQAVLSIYSVHASCWMTQLSGRVSSISKIRLVNVNTNQYYVDVYVANTGASGTSICVSFEGLGDVEVLTPTLITDEVTSAKELVLSHIEGTNITSSNFTEYTPTKTGTGATGTWNINIGGTAKALTPNSHTPAQCPTIGDLKASLIANMAAGGDIYYPVQSYNFAGSNVLSLKNNWATDSYAIADGSRTSFLRLDRYTSDKYGAFLMSGMSLAPLAGLSRLMLYDSKWYGPYLLLDEANYSSYALPLTGGTLTGSLNVAGNDLNLGNSAGANLFMNRPTHNYIWANTTGGDLYFGTSTSGVTAPSNAGIGIVGKNVCIGGTTSKYRTLTVASGIAIANSTNPLIDFRSSSGTVIGYVQAVDSGWMGIGPGNGKGLFIGSDGALTINATPPTTPTGNSIDAPKAIHSTTGVYSEGYVSARGVDSSSDERLKTDIKPLANALDYILGTKYRSFRWKEDGKQCIGVVAQEELGREHGYLVEKHNDYYSYNYAATTALLGAALQEEDGKVERLKARIAALEAELERLKYNS